MRHAQVDLALDPGAKTQRRHRDPGAVLVRRQVGDVTVDLDPGFAGQGCDRGRHVAADAMEAHRRQPRTDEREDVIDEPLHRIDIGRVPEAADEHQIVALVESEPGAGQLVQVGQQLDLRLRRVAREQRAFGFAHHQRGVDAGDQVQLQRARAFGAAYLRRIAGQCGATAFAQVVQVDGVEHDLRLRRMLAQQRQHFAQHVVAAGDDRVETRAMYTQPSGHAFGERRVPDLHAQLLQRLGIDAVMGPVGRQEHHVSTFLAQQADQVHQPQRGGVAVGPRRGRVDDQHVFPAGVRRRRGRVGGARHVMRQHLRPLGGEGVAVADLVGLDTLVQPRARGDAFQVHHPGAGLVEHLQAAGAHGEGQVGVFVVGRCVAAVEPAEPAEQLAQHRDRGARAIVGFAHEGITRVVGRFEAPVIAGIAVGEHDAARFLQATVGIHQLGADHAGTGMLVERGQQAVEPARLRQGVVVEEHQIFATRQCRAVIAGGDESAVVRAAQIA